jgi:hypothetical protein
MALVCSSVVELFLIDTRVDVAHGAAQLHAPVTLGNGP